MMNRRDFLAKSLRIGILAGITGGVVLLARNRQIDYNCPADGICKSCSKYTGCELDKAKENRKNER